VELDRVELGGSLVGWLVGVCGWLESERVRVRETGFGVEMEMEAENWE